MCGLLVAASALAQREPVYTYRYFLWGGAESPTKPPAGVNYIQVTFDRGNPVAYEKFKDIVPPVDVFGCMDKNATNYNVLATVDDGGCEYAPVLGCMDKNATNYNELATVDDKSCKYAPTATYDPGVKIGGAIWATRNVDAPGTFAAKPQDYGKFYQWNRKVAWAATGTVTDWDASFPLGITWEKANDPCPTGYRVPTKAEQDALVASGSTWTSNYNGTGVAGGIFGSGSNTVFLPAADYRYFSDGNLFDFVGAGANPDGYYWSSTMGGYSGAYFLFFSNGYVEVVATYRTGGFFVRCVKE